VFAQYARPGNPRAPPAAAAAAPARCAALPKNSRDGGTAPFRARSAPAKNPRPTCFLRWRSRPRRQKVKTRVGAPRRLSILTPSQYTRLSQPSRAIATAAHRRELSQPSPTVANRRELSQPSPAIATAAHRRELSQPSRTVASYRNEQPRVYFAGIEKVMPPPEKKSPTCRQTWQHARHQVGVSFQSKI
jgi:hypothetical protein